MKNDIELLTTPKMAKLAGIELSQFRYWHKHRLLPEVKRTKGNFVLYDPVTTRARIDKIVELKAAWMPIDHIYEELKKLF